MGKAALLTIADLNALDDDAAARALLRCCGSSRWASAMAAARPFGSEEAMRAQADAVWRSLDRADWLEAFAAHPTIGAGGPDPSPWSDEEQAGVAGAEDGALRRLAEGNHDYQTRFGYIFIVCATGKTAAEMLALLEGRLRHDAGGELPVAADEQRKITQLRLTKLLEQEPDTIS